MIMYVYLGCRYHGLIDKKTGETLYAQFVKEFQTQIAALNASASTTAAAGSAAAPPPPTDAKEKPAAPPATSAVGGSTGADSTVAGTPRFRVLHGTYGNRQAMKTENDGPLTHCLDF